MSGSSNDTNTSHQLTTQALVCKGIGQGYTLSDVEVTWSDSSLTTQAIVEFTASGVCQTDIHLSEGLLPSVFPFIGGHEGCGKILHLPRSYEGHLREGDWVVGSFKACTTCPNCKDGKPSQCHQLFLGNFLVDGTLDAFHPAIGKGVQFTLKDSGTGPGQQRVHGDLFGQSSFIRVGAVDLNCLVKVPDSVVKAGIPMHKFCAFGCGIQTGIGTVLNNLMSPIKRTFDHLPHFNSVMASHTRPHAHPRTSHQSIVIFGLGTVGSAAIIGARLSSCHTIIAVDVVQSKLDFAKLHGGATHTVNSTHFKDDKDPDALVKHIRSLTPYGQGANMSLEASGFPGVADTAIRVLATGGKAALVGAGPQGVVLGVQQHELLQNGWSVQGVFEGSSVPEVFLPYLMELYARGGDEWKVMDVSKGHQGNHTGYLLTLLPILALYSTTAPHYNLQAHRATYNAGRHEKRQDNQGRHRMVMLLFYYILLIHLHHTSHLTHPANPSSQSKPSWKATCPRKEPRRSFSSLPRRCFEYEYTLEYSTRQLAFHPLHHPTRLATLLNPSDLCLRRRMAHRQLRGRC